MSPLSSPGVPSPTSGISSDTSRLASSANLKKAGERFEAMFTQQMLKAMRQAKLSDPLLGSKAIDTFTEMSDAKVAQSMAEHQPLGIGKALTAFLAKGQAGTEFPSRSEQAQVDVNKGEGNASP